MSPPAPSPSFSLTRKLNRFSLRWLITIPFLIQTAGTVALVGYFSFRNGQRAINDLAHQLMTEIGSHIEADVHHYLSLPHRVNENNRLALTTGTLSPLDPNAMGQFFWNQSRSYPELNFVYFANPEGGIVLAGKRQDGDWIIRQSDRFQAGKYYTFATDKQGKRQEVLSITQYDARQRPWYQSAIQSKKAGWSPVYFFNSNSTLGFSASLPLYKSGRLQGVLASDLSLQNINSFLEAIPVGKTGQAYILERTGELIATSTNSQPFRKLADGTLQRITAQQSNQSLIRESSIYLKKQFPDWSSITQAQQSQVVLEDKKYYLQIRPLSDAYGLNWLVVVVVPEKDFMGQIHANTRMTVILCLLTCGASIVLGGLICQRLLSPITDLSQGAIALSQGQWDYPIQGEGAQELWQLSQSFQAMGKQLKKSFAALEEANQVLEQRVQERTKELRLSEQKFAAAFRSTPDPIFLLDRQTHILVDANVSFLQLVGLNHDCLDQVFYPEILGISREHYHKLLIEAQFQNSLRNLEWTVINHRGEDRLMVLSAEAITVNERALLLVVFHDITERKKAEELLKKEQEKSENLLLNILPETIVSQLKSTKESVAESFETVTILFADIVGFTDWSGGLPPIELVNILNRIFCRFDELTEKYGLEKIKTIGDAYMVVGGLPQPMENHAVAIASMALDMLAVMAEFRRTTPYPLSIRIGINTGPVVAGVIGMKKFIYDLWGDAVNVASRMESSGEADRIQVTAATEALLHSQFVTEFRGEVEIKGKGIMPTYWLLGAKITHLSLPEST